MDKSKFIDTNIITEDSKIVIGIGDSFCAGTGSESFETWEENDWDIEKMRRSDKAIAEAYENSFINILCQKHLPDYIPINFGMGGRGNKFAIKSLFIHPTIGIEKAKEKIVIFVVSGLERYDFLNDISDESSIHANTIFPSYGTKNKVGYAELTNFEGDTIFSDQFLHSEFIVDFIMLMQWCEIHKAKLLFMSAFTPRINRDDFFKVVLGEKRHNLAIKVTRAMVNKIPWHRQIFPQNFESIIYMLLHLEKKEELMNEFRFRDFKIDKKSEYGYISKCIHPTRKGQELLADIVYERILTYDDDIDSEFTKEIKLPREVIDERNKKLI